MIEALSGFGGQDITDRLITELGNTNAGVRLALVEALGKLGGREVAGALVSRLDDPDTGVRRAVVEALGKLGGEGVVGPLIRKLDDHPVVREAVVRALSNLGGQEVVSGLYGSLEDPHVGIRVLAAGTLAGLGDARGSAALVQFLHDANPEIRRGAVSAWAYASKHIAAVPLLQQFWRPPLWLDPEEPITEDRVAEASRYLGINPEDVRSKYEAVAKALDLKLSWRDRQPPPRVDTTGK